MKTALELARELRVLCRNFDPGFRLVDNMRCDEIEAVAKYVLDQTYDERSEMSRLKASDVEQGKRIAEQIATIATLKAALLEACDIGQRGWDACGLITVFAEDQYACGLITVFAEDQYDRLTKLRKLASDKP